MTGKFPISDLQRLRAKLSSAAACFVGVAALLYVCSSQALASGVSVPSSAADKHIVVSMIPEFTGVEAGRDIRIALRLHPEEGWHTYWRNPGDTGLPTRINWRLPEEFNAGEIQWPVPERINFDGLINYGYHGDTWLLVDIDVPERLPDVTELEFAATAKWLICKDVCIPGQVDLSLTLPVLRSIESDAGENVGGVEFKHRTDQFAEARGKIPQRLDSAIAQFAVSDQVVVTIDAEALPVMNRKPQLLVAKKGVIDNKVLPTLEVSQDQIVFRFNKEKYLEEAPESLPVILYTSDTAQSAIEFVAEYSQPESGYFPEGESAQQAAAPETAPRSLLVILVFALMGGFILNAMPCVFPVLSLKVISLVESGQHSAAERRQHGLAYTVGVVASFLLIAGLLIALRSLGEQIGWGFQLQSPLFIALLVYLMFALGLSLSGFIEFGAALQNVGGRFVDANRNSWQSSFATGVLATVVATPCTAPFMGTAMGFALSQPASVAALVFACMGFGLALPFFLIAFLPALANRLPAPGNWMVRLKELLAFPMYLTAVWLLWVFSRQVGVDALAVLLIGLVVLVFALWLWRLTQFRDGVRGLKAVALAALLLAAATIPFALSQAKSQSEEAAVTAGSEISQPYSESALQSALKTGQPVFVNMTADWCITCKVNEKVALQSSEVLSAFKNNSVIYLKGDWTNSDPVITRYLEKFNRNGVPLYVFYAPEKAPVLLPQILTPDIVVSAIEVSE